MAKKLERKKGGCREDRKKERFQVFITTNTISKSWGQKDRKDRGTAICGGKWRKQQEKKY